MKAVLGEEGARAMRGMGSSMQATELGALAQCGTALLCAADEGDKRTGYELLRVVARRVREEVLLVPSERDVTPRGGP